MRASVQGMSPEQLARKLANTDEFTVGELAAIARLFSVDPAELQAVIA